MNSNSNNLKKLDSIKRTSRYFNIGENKLRELVRSDPDLPCIKINSHVKIITDLFPEYLEKKWREGKKYKSISYQNDY